LTSCNKACKESSRAFCSFEMTLPSNCCSNPDWVTLKSIMVVLAESSGENEGFGKIQIKNILNYSLKSIVDPPTSINCCLPLVWIYFSKTGSKIGSTSFSMDSMMRVFPSSMEYFKNMSLNLGWFKVVMQRGGSMNSLNFSLIQRTPWPCGSTSKGYLVEFVTMIPF